MRPRFLNREVVGWCLYDFANSSYTTLIITVAYAVYFKKVVRPQQDGEFWWGVGLSTSMVLVALAAPVLGAIADGAGAKKRFLLCFSLVCIVGTAALWFVGPGDLALGLVLLVISNIGFEGGLVFYNAMLTDLVEPAGYGRVSGWGWATGYLGGMACLGVCYGFIADARDSGAEALSATFPTTALFFLLAALPTFLWVRERSRGALPGVHGLGYVGEGFRRLSVTWREVRRYRQVLRLLLADFVYNDGIHTVIFFASIFAAETMRMDPAQIFIFMIVINLVAAPGAFLFGYVFERLGGVATIRITLWMWAGVALWAFLVHGIVEFYLLGALAGIAMGGALSCSRSLAAAFMPPDRSGEFFGLFAVCNKFAAIFGPLVWGGIVYLTGNQRLAVLAVGVFFVAGWLLLERVEEAEGRAAAREASAAPGASIAS